MPGHQWKLGAVALATDLREVEPEIWYPHRAETYFFDAGNSPVEATQLPTTLNESKLLRLTLKCGTIPVLIVPQDTGVSLHGRDQTRRRLRARKNRATQAAAVCRSRVVGRDRQMKTDR